MMFMSRLASPALSKVFVVTARNTRVLFSEFCKFSTGSRLTRSCIPESVPGNLFMRSFHGFAGKEDGEAKPEHKVVKNQETNKSSMETKGTAFMGKAVKINDESAHLNVNQGAKRKQEHKAMKKLNRYRDEDVKLGYENTALERRVREMATLEKKINDVIDQAKLNAKVLVKNKRTNRFANPECIIKNALVETMPKEDRQVIYARKVIQNTDKATTEAKAPDSMVNDSGKKTFNLIDANDAVTPSRSWPRKVPDKGNPSGQRGYSTATKKTNFGKKRGIQSEDAKSTTANPKDSVFIYPERV